jgi:hypothetical protein
VRITHHPIAVLVAVLVVLCVGSTTTTYAAQSVELHATFTPEQLGRGTTIHFGFQVTAPDGRVPPALTMVDVRYPGDLGIALSGLGISTCRPSELEDPESGRCPPNSRMGYGTAIAEIPIGPLILYEEVKISVYRAPTQAGHLALIFYADGNTPVDAEIFFLGFILPTDGPFGGDISLHIPLVPSLPGAPDVAVVKLQTTLGPQRLTYYENVRGKKVSYHPKGILLPNDCPRGGFPFAASFTFLDGSHSNAGYNIPCPRG